MSDRAKPWLDTTWRVHPGGFSNLLQHTGYHLAKFGAPSEASVTASVKLAAAAPALARALCRVEWEGSLNPSGDPACPECRRPPQAAMGASGLYPGGHAPDCHIDAWLTAAGLTAEDREEVRRG